MWKEVILVAWAYRDEDKNAEIKRQDTWSPRRDLHPGSPEYEAGMLPLHSIRSAPVSASLTKYFFCKRPVPKRRPSHPVEDHVPNHVNLYYYEF
jgi:hypothetical protein